MLSAEKRVHPSDTAAYVYEDFIEFAVSSGWDCAGADRMWNESSTLLESETLRDWKNLRPHGDNNTGVVCVCTAPRFLHDELKYALSDKGMRAKLGRKPRVPKPPP